MARSKRSPISEVFVGLTEIPIRYREMDESSGLWNGLSDPVITVNDKMPVLQQNMTILHEVLHAISEMYNLEWSERDVRTVEQALAALVHDNPALFKALMK